MNSVLVMRQFIGQLGMTFNAGHMSDASKPIFTIGHSSRPLDMFLELLADSSIACMVHVRRLPGSRRFPQYNADALTTSLAEHGIDYWHLAALCGRRSKG